MKHKNLIFILFALCFNISSSFAYLDSLWEVNLYNQFFKIYNNPIFSKNDSILAVSEQNFTLDYYWGQSRIIFLDAKTGNLLKEIPGRYFIGFFNNDKNFILKNDTLNRFDIYDSYTYAVIDSLVANNFKISVAESDFANKIGERSTILPIISKDTKYLITPIDTTSGLCIWDLETKSIKKIKSFKTNEPNLAGFTLTNINYNCDNTMLFCQYYKTVQYWYIKEWKYKVTKYLLELDANTLDSTGVIYNADQYEISNDCQKMIIKSDLDSFKLKLIDINTKNSIKVFTPKLNNYYTLYLTSFSKNDKYFLLRYVDKSNYHNNCVGVLNLSTNEIDTTIFNHFFADMINSNQGKYICLFNENSIKVFNNPYFYSDIIEKPITSELIYPNPVSNALNIDIDFVAYKYEIYTSTGFLVQNGALNEPTQKISIDLSSIFKNTYFIKIIGANKSITYKFQKI